MRSAIPGLLATLAAATLLGIVSFCVPYFKSERPFTHGENGTITFGTLGFCVELVNGTMCSKNLGLGISWAEVKQLVGNHNPHFQIP
ncbi:hypothetical protein D9758_011497 [Tetrapyrgos nigripes]|uniref:Uncharacterized protein n=1 Tax=Tetrapyrgos nigripes TaxID=182062 RepID=A0A8H5FRN7_9AGAR|nr:hypothetical protein D9758_011497 [Tetrapyrgos nigripes]